MATSVIEWEFQDEIRLKKQIGRGIFARTGKRGYVGTMRLPSDFLSRKEKKSYQASGRCVTYSMFQSLMSLQDFQRKSQSEQKLVMENWRTVYKPREIIAALGMNFRQYGDLLTELGIEKKSKPLPQVDPNLDIISYEQFQQLPPEEQKETLMQLRHEQPSNVIQVAWGLSRGQFRKLIEQLGIPSLRTKEKSVKELQEILFQEQLLSFSDFKKLSSEQQAEIPHAYKNRFSGSTKELSKAWGVPIATLYGTTKRLRHVAYTPNVPELAQLSEQQEEAAEEGRQMVEDRWGEVREQLRLAALETAATTETAQPEEPPYDETPISAMQDESVRVMQEQIQQLTAMVQALTAAPQQLAASTESKADHPTAATTFTVSYEAEKEGFLAAQELAQYLRMLEKNPNSYRVSLQITQIEK